VRVSQEWSSHSERPDIFDLRKRPVSANVTKLYGRGWKRRNDVINTYAGSSAEAVNMSMATMTITTIGE
jgi:hypothetical protein